MAKLARILVGFRDDLPLSERWWHRLAKVVFLTTSLIAVVGIVWAASQFTPTASEANVLITQTLERHRQSDGGMTSVQSFMAIPGKVGVRNDDGSIGQWLQESEVSSAICAVGEPVEVGRSVGLTKTDEEKRVDDIATKLGGTYEDRLAYIIPDTVGGKTGHCFMPRLVRNGIAFKPFDDPFEKWRVEHDSSYGHSSGLPLELLTADRIVKWKYAPAAYAEFIGFVVGMFVAFVFVLLNAYYRGLIYIAFGPRSVRAE